MKSKKIITLALAAAMVSVSALSVSAASLTNSQADGKTEVQAHISGSTTGNVTYKITIPDKVTFEPLSRPETSGIDSYKTAEYAVSLDEVSNLGADEQISVYVKDQNASVNDDQNFYIANVSNSNIKFKYQVFDVPKAQVREAVSINANPMTKAAGYYLAGFTAVDDRVDGTLVINEAQLWNNNYTLSDIVGDYSGYMVFYSAVEKK